MSKKAKRPETLPTTNVEGRLLVSQTISDTELAQKLGLSRMGVWKWREIPANRVQQVAEATGLKPEWIRPQPYA